MFDAKCFVVSVKHGWQCVIRFAKNLVGVANLETRLIIDLNDGDLPIESLDHHLFCVRSEECSADHNHCVAVRVKLTDRLRTVEVLVVRLVKEHAVGLHIFPTLLTLGHVVFDVLNLVSRRDSVECARFCT